MKIVSWEKAPKAIWQEYIVVVEHQPSWLAKVLFRALPERVTYRGRACWWHRADTGEIITTLDGGRDSAAKRMLTNAYTMCEWAALDGRPIKEELKIP